MRETGKAGAGMAEPPKHHVLPNEYREWFEQRGFTGDMDIDQFCVQLEPARPSGDSRRWQLAPGPHLAR